MNPRLLQSPLESLREAQALICHESDWTDGIPTSSSKLTKALALSANGAGLANPWDPKAVRWTASGALQKVSYLAFSAHDYLQEACQELFDVYIDEADGLGHEAVMAIYNLAIQNVKDQFSAVHVNYSQD